MLALPSLPLAMIRQVYNIQETSMKRIHECQEQKTCRNYDIYFFDQDFIIGFCQIELDLFMTFHNTHNQNKPKRTKINKKKN